MKFKIASGVSLIMSLILFGFINNSYAQNDSAILAAADTSRFSVNTSDGWLLYNSSVDEHGTDSAQLVLIIRHENNISWIQEHFVGRIKYVTLIPQNNQTLVYNLLSDQYSLRVDTTGRCYLKLESGNSPTNNPVVLSLIFYYKR